MSPFAKLSPEFCVFPYALDEVFLFGSPGNNIISVDSKNHYLVPPYNKKNDLYIIRLLLKMGLEILLTNEKFDPFQSTFDNARIFSRYCNPGTWWDLGYTIYPKKDDLKISERFDEFGSIINHQLYQFELGQMASGDMILCFIYRTHIFACNLSSPSLAEYVDGFNLLNYYNIKVYKAKA